MNSVWVFGDSMTAPISGKFPEKSSPYSEWLGRYAKVSCEMLAEHFDFEPMNRGVAGASNNQIFANFLKEHTNIKSGDIVVIGWSPIMRYRIASYSKFSDSQHTWLQIWARGYKPQVENTCLDGKWLTEEVAEQIVLNRNEFKDLYSEEINEWTSFIKEWADLKGVTVITWTWCQKEFGGEHSINVDIPPRRRTDMSMETDNMVKDGHYGEVGHKELFEEILDYLKRKNSKKLI